MVKPLLTTTAVTLALASAGLAQQQEPGPVVIQGEHGQTQTRAPAAQGQQGQQDPTAQSAAALSPEQVRRIQQRLGELGFDPGPVDGIWGAQTRAALQEFQEARGLEPTGDPTEPTLAELGVEGGDERRAGAATAASGTEVTGIVTSVDEQTGEIVIDGQTYVMPEEGGGAALLPAEGDEVTLFYREEGGRKVITRIGQPRPQ